MQPSSYRRRQKLPGLQLLEWISRYTWTVAACGLPPWCQSAPGNGDHDVDCAASRRCAARCRYGRSPGYAAPEFLGLSASRGLSYSVMFVSPGAIAFQIPAIFGFGPFPVRWYGILMATSIVVGLWLAHRQAKREGLPADDIIS